MTRARQRSRRQTSLGLMLLAFVGLAGWLSTVAINGLPWSTPYQVRLALPQGAPILHSGDEVRVGGERVGQVQSVSLPPGSRQRATATLSLNSGFRIGTGASARIRPRGLAGAVYVDVSPGDVGHPRPSGALIGASGGVQITDVIAGFDSQARGALQQILNGYGTGLAGRGVAVGHVIAGAPARLANTTTVLHALQPRPGTLSADIGDARSLAGTVAGSGALPGLIASATRVAGTTAAGAPQIAATLRALPRLEQTTSAILPQADRLLATVTGTSQTLEPGISALADALPGVRALEDSAPEVSGLAQTAGRVPAVLHALLPVLSELPGPASGLVPLSSPVARLASVLIPYRSALIQAPLGFTRWGNFRYDFGTGAGHRAVRFSMVLTCAFARDPYPRPGAADRERKQCP